MPGQIALTALRTPKSDAEWARTTQRRLEAAEHSTTQRVGRWVLIEHPTTGDLIAAHESGGAVLLSTVPDSTADPDQVAEATLQLRVRRDTDGAAGTVDWETTDFAIGAVWNMSDPPGEAITIPATGVWTVQFNAVATGGIGNRTIWLARNGDQIRRHATADATPTIVDTFTFSGGDQLTAGAEFTHGAMSDYPAVTTSLVLLHNG